MELAIQQHLENGHATPLDPKYGPCDACIRAKLQDKPAFQISKSKLSKEQHQETVNGDLIDMSTIDCAGNRYNFTNVVDLAKSRLGMSKGLPVKTSIAVRGKDGLMVRRSSTT